MYRHRMLNVLAVALGCALLPAGTVAQQTSKPLKEQIVGTWKLVSWEQTLQDGAKNNRFGNNANGINVFTPDGHFTLIMMRSDLPKVSSGNPEKLTGEKAQTLARGSIAYFGTYTVDETSSTVYLHIDGTRLANQLGIEQR